MFYYTKNLKKGKNYIDLVIRSGSMWVGVHHSRNENAYCVTLFPCFTVRFGKTPYKKDSK